MALIKLAAAGAAAYGLYRIVTRKLGETARSREPQPALAGNLGGPTTVPSTPVGLGGNYVSPT